MPEPPITPIGARHCVFEFSPSLSIARQHSDIHQEVAVDPVLQPECGASLPPERTTDRETPARPERHDGKKTLLRLEGFRRAARECREQIMKNDRRLANGENADLRQGMAFERHAIATTKNERHSG